MLNRPFKRRPNRNAADPILRVLDLKEEAFVDYMRARICDLNPSGGIMTLVAYMNVDPLLGAMKDIYKNNTKALPIERLDTIEGFIEWLYNDYHSLAASSQNEIPRRRTLWFIHALLVMRANQIAERARAYEDAVAEIWIHLIACSRGFGDALQHNVMWSIEEKKWFGTASSPLCFVLEERPAMLFCANHIMPKWLRENGKLTEHLRVLEIERIFESDSIFYDMS